MRLWSFKGFKDRLESLSYDAVLADATVVPRAMPWAIELPTLRASMRSVKTKTRIRSNHDMVAQLLVDLLSFEEQTALP